MLLALRSQDCESLGLQGAYYRSKAVEKSTITPGAQWTAAVKQQELDNNAQGILGYVGSMPFCVELDNLKDTDVPIHQPAKLLVAAD